MAKRRESNQTNKMRLRLDFSNMMSDFVGVERGITRAEIDELGPKAMVIAASIEARRQKGELGFYQLPYDTKTATAVAELADSFQGKCDDFVVLGIGGSALGATALFRALCHPLHNLLSKSKRGGRPRVFVLDNIDPTSVKSVLDFINPKKTVFNVITKSGSTAETLSQFLIVREMLEEKIGKESVAEHIVVTTGEGPLKALAKQASYPLLSVPENVGGRFSVFGPVGLFPAAMFGVDIADLLAGARDMDERCKTDRLWQNPAYLSGALHYLADVRKGLSINVMMPYSDALLQVAVWFRQLWAESLGKAKNLSGKIVNVGQTPVVALGATDQHSQLQLYSEGPFNKMIAFLLVENHGAKMPIPPQAKQSEFAYLGRHSLEEMMKIEAESTRLALTKGERSNMSLILPEINAFTVGQLLFLLEVQTVFAGGLYYVNPMDQPGVEASKQYIYGMMGRKGFESKARAAREWQERKSQYII